jgi:hypothetical protein
MMERRGYWLQYSTIIAGHRTREIVLKYFFLFLWGRLEFVTGIARYLEATGTRFYSP